MPAAERVAEVLVPVNLESAEHRLVRRNVERIVASQKRGRVGRQRRPERVDRSVESERVFDVPEGRDQPGFSPRPESRMDPAQSTQRAADRAGPSSRSAGRRSS